MVVCSNQKEEKSHIISKLHLYRRPYTVPSQITKYQQYLQQHFMATGEPQLQTKAVLALEVDCERFVHRLHMFCIFQ